jgi:hypothetical protein
MNLKTAANAASIATAPVLAATAVIWGLAACGPTTSSTTAPPPASSSSPAMPAATTAPPAPKPAQTLLKFSGHGSESTPHFTSASGDYKVSWAYSGNSDMYGGSNFIVTELPESDFNTPLSLPNDIQDHGSGSAEASGDSGSHSFNVQSVGNWTITVTTAP